MEGAGGGIIRTKECKGGGGKSVGKEGRGEKKNLKTERRADRQGDPSLGCISCTRTSCNGRLPVRELWAFSG